ncbi:patatin-like phospholipase family protein [Nonomuraea sp. NPDC049649]|uniref:patatin-like phospholipase family protein n=1 Tax=Nonomuraea sp. NPDC049649 TaxID=3155776 RepID=UPI003416E5FE
MARTGLVLAGGGAKGAYQVGVIEYLAERDVRVAAVAGTSIGALNGAVLTSSDSLRAAAVRLRALWDEVGRTADAGGRPATLVEVARMATGPVVRPDFVEDLMEHHVDLGRLPLDLPFWVTMFPALPPMPFHPDGGWLADLARAASGAQAHWVKLNDLPVPERRQAVLASAALPIIMPGRWVGGTFYRDGGLGGMYANAPAGPLVTEGELDLILVTHLTRGVLWDAQRFPNATILEIRPSEALNGPGLLNSTAGLLDFSARRLEGLREQGYQDARRTLERAGDVLDAAYVAREAQDVMLDAVGKLDDDLTEEQ